MQSHARFLFPLHIFTKSSQSAIAGKGVYIRKCAQCLSASQWSYSSLFENVWFKKWEKQIRKNIQGNSLTSWPIKLIVILNLAGIKVIENIFTDLFTVLASEEITALHFLGRVLAKLEESYASIQVSSFRYPVWLTAAVEVHQLNTPAAFLPLDKISCLKPLGRAFSQFGTLLECSVLRISACKKGTCELQSLT